MRKIAALSCLGLLFSLSGCGTSPQTAGASGTGPEISPLALLSGLGMLIVGLGFLGYALGRKLGWKYLLLGMLGWVVTVALKFAWAIPLNSIVYKELQALLPGLVVQPVFALYVGALTGVFEVAVTYLTLRFTPLGRAQWSRALAFGIGFGAVEAIFLSLSPLVSVVIALVNPGNLSSGQLASIAQLNNPLYGLAPVVERFFTIWVHILSNVLIFYAIAKKQPRWFWLAFVYKTLIDAVAAGAQLSGMLNQTGTAYIINIWLIEAVVVIWGLAGVWGTRWVERRYPL